MKERNYSIFQEFYTEQPFVDRFKQNPEKCVDVIIPIIHTNELWETNLYSFYREIPIHKLLIGDAGCIDNSISIVQKFPRVQILDHRSYKSLGYSIRKLIEAVEREWFVYLHSDVYLPSGWFDAMYLHQVEYDWFGCPMEHTIMVEYDVDYGERPWAGSQMGRKHAFGSGLNRIEDDYVYRQEDFVFADIVKKEGFKEGKVTDTFHYHQTMRKATPWSRKVKKVQIDLEMSHEEEVRAAMMQVKGFIKYLDPDLNQVSGIMENIYHLEESGEIRWSEFIQWVEITNPKWLPYLLQERSKSGFSGRLRKHVQNFFGFK